MVIPLYRHYRHTGTGRVHRYECDCLSGVPSHRLAPISPGDYVRDADWCANCVAVAQEAEARFGGSGPPAA